MTQLGIPIKWVGYSQCPRPRLQPSGVFTLPPFLKPNRQLSLRKPRTLAAASAETPVDFEAREAVYASLRGARISTKNRFQADRPPHPAVEIFAREQQHWKAANPVRQARLDAIEETELKNLDRKRRDKFPVHFSTIDKPKPSRFDTILSGGSSVGSSSWM